MQGSGSTGCLRYIKSIGTFAAIFFSDSAYWCVTELRLNEKLVCDGPLRRDCATKAAGAQITTQVMCTVR
jgi:hypothetical protein